MQKGGVTCSCSPNMSMENPPLAEETQVFLILCYSLFTSFPIGLPQIGDRGVVEILGLWRHLAVSKAAAVPAFCPSVPYKYNFLFGLCCEKIRKQYAMPTES